MSPLQVSLLIKNDSACGFDFELAVEHNTQKDSKMEGGSVYERWMKQSTTPFICLESDRNLGVVRPKACRETVLRFIPLREGTHFLLPVKLTLSDKDKQQRIIRVADAHKIIVTNKANA